MLLDVTGMRLVPGNGGRDCPGNGESVDEQGRPVGCCCEECDYAVCCFENAQDYLCTDCRLSECPRAPVQRRAGARNTHRRPPLFPNP